MAELSDETLMAYADGELDPARRASVTHVLANDPAARARLEQLLTTDRAIQAHFQAVLAEPVPQALVDLVLDTGRQGVAARELPPVHSRPPGLLGSLRRWLATGLTMRQLAFACLATLVAGVAIGWQLSAAGPRTQSGATALFALEDGILLATGALERMLETEKSGALVPLGIDSLRDMTARARLTFKSAEGGYCRQYEVARPDGRQLGGIGCRRSDGRWQLRAHMQIEDRPAASGPYKAAGAASSILAVIVERTMAGDALGAAEEAVLLGGKWRP